jgi:hypothetical protein
MSWFSSSGCRKLATSVMKRTTPQRTKRPHIGEALAMDATLVSPATGCASRAELRDSGSVQTSSCCSARLTPSRSMGSYLLWTIACT